MIVANPPARNYMVIDMQAASDDARTGLNPDEFIRALQKLSAEADHELGSTTIDGSDALGYEIGGRTLGLGIDPDARSELWVDSRTSLPVRYVAEVPGFEAGKTFTLVYDRFEWDTPLDPRLFEPEQVHATLFAPRDDDPSIRHHGAAGNAAPSRESSHTLARP